MDLLQRWVALPRELFDLIITDFQLLLLAKIALSAAGSGKTHELIIKDKEKKFEFDLRTAIRYNSIKCVRVAIDKYISQFTLQARVRKYIEINSLYGYDLFVRYFGKVSNRKRNDLFIDGASNFLVYRFPKYFIHGMMFNEQYSDKLIELCRTNIIPAFHIIMKFDQCKRERILRMLDPVANAILIAVVKYVHKVTISDDDFKAIKKTIRYGRHELGEINQKIGTIFVQAVIYYILNRPELQNVDHSCEYKYQQVLISGLSVLNNEHHSVFYSAYSKFDTYGQTPEEYFLNIIGVPYSMESIVYFDTRYMVKWMIFAPHVIYKYRSHIKYILHTNYLHAYIELSQYVEPHLGYYDYDEILPLLDTKEKLVRFLTLYAQIFEQSFTKEAILHIFGDI